MRQLVVAVMAAAITVAACSGDPTSTGDYQELEGEFAALEQELSAVTAERDLLRAEKAKAEERFDKSSATIDAIGEIVSDPSAHGTEDEGLALLGEHFVPGATTHYLAYGEIDAIDGWRNTLFGGRADAVTTEWHNWVCEDGSQGGSLWTWEGNNFVGEPFELIGMSVAGFNDEGLNTGNTVMWPYPDEYVWDEFGVLP